MTRTLSRTLAGITLMTMVFMATSSFSQNNQSADNEPEQVENATSQAPKDDIEQSQDSDLTVGSTDNTDSQPVAEPEKKATEPEKKIDRLSVASWGGAYMQAQSNAFIKDYKKNEGIELSSIKHSGKYSVIKTKLTTPEWDVVDLTYDMVERACSEGLLEPINQGNLENGSDGSSPSDDFLKDGLHKCGVASMVWSLAIIYNKPSFKRRRIPSRAKDFFDPKRFRGKRALPRTAENVLELALLADGAKPDEVYLLLETSRGIDRAFRVLNRIKKRTVWWTSASEPYALLNSGKVSFALGYSGKAFSMIAEQKKPYGIIWDAQLYNYNLWAIPKQASNKKRAESFIAYATKPEKLAVQSSWFPYGPARHSAIRMIKLHPEADINMKPYIPTIEENFKVALRRDKMWWQTRGQIVKARFERWIRNEKEVFGEADIAYNDKALEQSDVPVLPEPEPTENSDGSSDGASDKKE